MDHFARQPRTSLLRLGLVAALVAPSLAAPQIEFGGPDGDVEAARVELYNQLRSEPRETAESRVAQAVGPAVVYVETEMVQSVRTFIGTEPRLRRGSGSGVVIHPSGLIVTNYHVVENARQLRVSFEGDAEPYPAELMSFVREEDLALLKIVKPGTDGVDGTFLSEKRERRELAAKWDRRSPPRNSARELQASERTAFPTVRLGTSADLMPGERVVAIGSPHGQTYTVSKGIISGLHRDVPVPSRGLNFRGLIQTDASINFGNSGGPLLNIHGELIGINTVMNASAENIGFAIPVDRVRQIVEDVLLPNARKVWLGFDYEARPGGIVVTRVWPEGPAAASGICEGDRIATVEGVEVADEESLNLQLLNLAHDQVAQLGIQRDDRLVDTPLRAWDALNGEFFMDLGLTVTETRPGPRGAPCLQVQKVRPDSPAAELGVEPGDLLPAIKPRLGRASRTVWLSDKATLKMLLERIPKGTEIEVDAYRDLDGDKRISKAEQLKGVLVR